jgi:hypothetical protein
MEGERGERRGLQCLEKPKWAMHRTSAPAFAFLQTVRRENQMRGQRFLTAKTAKKSRREGEAISCSSACFVPIPSLVLFSLVSVISGTSRGRGRPRHIDRPP